MNKTALLIIDLQNDYFEGGKNPLHGSFEASLNARKVLEKFREKKQQIVHVQHISTRPGSTFFLPETDGCNIHTNVQPLTNEKVIVKHYPNSFRETDLHAYFQSLGINHLVICGMMTHMCVDTTVRASRDLGYEITLLGDACATKDLQFEKIVKAEDVHQSFLAALNSVFAKVETTSDYLKKN